MEYLVCRLKMRTLGDVSNALLNFIFKSMAAIQEAQPLKVATISESEMGDNGAYQTIHYLWTQVFSLTAH